MDNSQTYSECNGEQNNQISYDGKNSDIHLFGGHFKSNWCEFVWEVLLSTA